MGARKLLWWMVAVLLLAAALRLLAFGEVPPGLYHDEAYHGLDALDVLRGRAPLYFSANNGREPLFIYWVALVVGALGKSPFALRLVSYFIGVLTVAATAAMGRALFSRRVGLLAAAVLAITLWHVHLSRVGFRAVLLPLFTALTVWQGALGVKRAGERGIGGVWRHWLMAGVFYGLSFYSYMAARFTPVAWAVFGVYILAARRAGRGLSSALRDPVWRGLGLALGAALVVTVPLGVYTLAHPDVVLGRPGQVSIFDPAINGGDLWGALGAHTLRTAGMFFVRGDRIWRHNVPWRPVFDPLLGGAFLLGLAVAVRQARRRAEAGFVLIWTAVMSLPTLLAEDAPHFLRAVGTLPAVVFLPALGLDWLANRLPPRAPSRFRLPTLVSRRLARLAVVGVPLLFGLGSTIWAYFGEYARDPMAGYWFERGAVALGGRINQALGWGWDGERMMYGDPDGRRPLTPLSPRSFSTERWIYVDPRLWEDWPQVRFLTAAPEMLIVQPLDPQHGPGLEGQGSDDPVAVFVWPYDDWQQAWRLLPTPAEITVEEGPLSQGDRDLEPYTTYLALFAAPPDPTFPAMARFSEGIELLEVEVALVDEGHLRVRLRWRARAALAEDYTVFLQYLRDGERIAQADSRPAQGRYPTPRWRPGDVVNDDHYLVDVSTPLPGRDELLFGLWQPESGAVLPLLDEAGNPAGDWIVVPVGSVVGRRMEGYVEIAGE